MELAGSDEVRIGVHPNKEKSMGRDRSVVRQNPFGQVRQVVGKCPSIQERWRIAAIIEFNPGLEITGYIQEPGGIVRCDFVDPDRREIIEILAERIGSVRSE